MQVSPQQILAAFRPVSRRASLWRRTYRKFEHIFTARLPDHESLGRTFGQSLWGTLDDELPMAICWDWVEVRRGVIALSNPMGIVSNVLFVDDSGEGAELSRGLLELNTAVHELNWQPVVQEEMATWRMFDSSRTPLSIRSYPSLRDGSGNRAKGSKSLAAVL